jgi:transposase
VKIFLANRDVVEMCHAPYSPDLAPADYFPFPKMKIALKGKRFQDVEDIKKNVTAKLNALLSETFSDCFQKRFKR